MTAVALPAHIQPLYSAISKKYSVAFEDLRLGDTPLKILQVTDLEALLGDKDPFADVGNFPFWIKLWESAMVLASMLSSMNLPAGHRLLELGAGLGAPGLAAARHGCAVTLSDYQQTILDFERISAAANGLDNVTCTLIDWKNPPDIEPFDTIVGAEILFREEFFQPLLALFDRYLAPDGTIYLSHDIRRKSLPSFLKRAERHFEVAVSTRKLTSDDENMTIIVNRLRRR